MDHSYKYFRREKISCQRTTICSVVNRRLVAFVIIMFIAYAEHANSRGKCLWLTVNQAWLAGLWKTVERKRKKFARIGAFQTRTIELWEFRGKKLVGDVFAYRTHVQIPPRRLLYTHMYMCTTYIIFYFILYTLSLAQYNYTLAPCPANTTTCVQRFCEGFFWIIPKGYRDGRVYL